MAAKEVVVGVILAIVCLSAAVSASRSETEIAALFEEWLQDNPSAYSSDTGAKNIRYGFFKYNLNIIDDHNAKESSYKLGLNGFADLTLMEFKSKYFGYLSSGDTETTPFRYANVTPPAFIDWREEGAVTPIKNQENCGIVVNAVQITPEDILAMLLTIDRIDNIEGHPLLLGSCWAFSSVGAVEGIVQIKTRHLISLSEHGLVSCDTGSFGCGGGWTYQAFGWIMINGINSEEDYPYTGQADLCSKAQKANTQVASIDGREKVPANNEKALQKAVANQPVSIALDAGDHIWMLYASGILSGSCGTDLDHALVVIGYGISPSGKDYWILKNSWGLTWGENGYLRLERNVASPEGMCGIAMEGSYPTKN